VLRVLLWHWYSFPDAYISPLDRFSFTDIHLISRLYRPAPHLLVKYQVAWSVPKYDLYEVWEDEIFYVRVEHLLNVVGLYDVSSQTNHIPKVDSYNLASKDCVSLLLYPIVEFWFWVFCFNNSLSCFLLIPSIVH
jgi:hypothetical protein